jgi:hypothetical protein
MSFTVFPFTVIKPFFMCSSASLLEHTPLLAMNLLSRIFVLSVFLYAESCFPDGFTDRDPGLPAGFRCSISVNYQGAKVRLFGDNPIS